MYEYPPQQKVVGDNGVELFGDWVEDMIEEKGARSTDINPKTNAIPTKPLNGSGLAVLRDWVLFKIASIPVGPDLSEATDDATATAGDILSGKTAYVKGTKVSGTIPTKASSDLTASGATVSVPAGYFSSATSKSVNTATQATPVISVDANGLITVNATQDAGYVSAGTKTATQQLSVKTSSDMTASGATVTAPAGYYTSNQSKSVATTTQATPTIAVSSTGQITASATQAEGYVTAGTKSSTTQLTVRTSSDMTVSGSTVTAPAGYYTSNQSKSVSTATQATPSVSITNSTGVVTASATQTAGYVSSGTKSNTLSLTTQAAQTITPGTANKTISAYRWLTGTQTIAGDANLVSANIKSGVSIFGVAGSIESPKSISATWTGTTLSTSLKGAWNDITFGNGYFVAVSGGGSSSNNGKIMNSANGTAWSYTQVTTSGGSNYDFNAVCYGNGKFLAAGSVGFGGAYSTDNGKNWTGVNIYTNPSAEVVCCCYGYNSSSNSHIYIASLDTYSSSSGDGVRYSYDCVTWRSGAPSYISTNAYGSAQVYFSFTCICHDGNKFVGIGSNHVAHGTDGLNWTVYDMIPDGTYKSIAYGDGKYVAITGTTAVFSTDGIGWTSSYPFPSNFTASTLNKVTYGNGVFVIVTNGNQCLYSADGLNWKVSTMAPTGQIWKSVCYGYNKFLAVSYLYAGSNIVSSCTVV